LDVCALDNLYCLHRCMYCLRIHSAFRLSAAAAAAAASSHVCVTVTLRGLSLALLIHLHTGHCVAIPYFLETTTPCCLHRVDVEAQWQRQ